MQYNFKGSWCCTWSIYGETKTWLHNAKYKSLRFTFFRDCLGNHFPLLYFNLAWPPFNVVFFFSALNRIWLVAMLPLRSWRHSCASFCLGGLDGRLVIKIYHWHSQMRQFAELLFWISYGSWPFESYLMLSCWGKPFVKHVDFIFKTKCICCSYTSMTLSSLKLKSFQPYRRGG